MIVDGIQEQSIGGDDAPRVRDLFTQKYRGSRYSFGYPACPEMSDQEKLFKLFGFLEATKDRNSKGVGLGLSISQ